MNFIKPDILPSKHRPTSIDGFKCHSAEALRLKQWIQDFINDSSSHRKIRSSDYDNSSDSEQSQQVILKPRCVLLTGPPGVGKTSLVYTIADELKLHVVESHSSEKRDFKLFSSLKLANQKGKINPIAKLFQFAQTKDQQQQQQNGSRRKRLKLIEPNQPDKVGTNQLSLSGDTSILLFDDIDVVFEEDGPFIKSLVEFIRETKRPVVLTATQSIEYIKNQLGLYEHIHLSKPVVRDCALILKDICRRENYNKLCKISRCSRIADYYDCDIRQCLNRIHFYTDQADHLIKSDQTQPDFTKLYLSRDELDTESCKDNNKSLLNCYTTCSLVDLMNDKLRLESKSNSLNNWMQGLPSSKIEEYYNFNQDLGEQIRESIVELNKLVHQDELVAEQRLIEEQEHYKDMRDKVLNVGHKVSDRLITRVEPHESDFFIDIVPLFGEVLNLELSLRKSCDQSNQLRRRTRRMPSYLEENGLYFEDREIEDISTIGTGFRVDDDEDTIELDISSYE